MLQGQRVLVTGATGQVARPLAETLQRNGNEVFAGARHRDEGAKAELEAQGITAVTFSLGDADLSHLPDVDYVIHCAANTFPATADKGIRDNATGVGFLMERYAGVKGFFHMSSSSVYFEQDDPAFVYDEESVLGGYSNYAPHYAMSKMCGEAVVKFQSARLGLPAVMGRLNVAYGTAGHGGLPLVLAGMLLAGHAYQRVPGQDCHASPIFEDDIAAQVQSMVQKAEVGAPVVNLGGDEIVTLGEIIGELESLTGKTMSFVDGDEPVFNTQALDNTRRLEFGGPCQVDWRTGLRRALEVRHPEALNG